jgi:vitamin B12 transporter
VSFSKAASFSVAIHQTVYDNLIAWFDADGDPSTWWDGSYENISDAKTAGVDLAFTGGSGALSYGLSGSLLRTEDDQGEQLLRRPKQRWGANLGYKPSEKSSLDLNAVLVGEREEWGDITLDAYTLVNLSGSYQVGENVELTGRIENLLDEEYEEAAGYGTPGVAGYVGIKAEL